MLGIRRAPSVLGVASCLALALLAPSAGAGGVVGPAQPATRDALTVTPVGKFDAPVAIESAPGLPGTIFVVERSGVVRVVRDGETLARPFLQISSIVLGPPDPEAGGEQGLLSLAFPPDYETSGLLYVLFTNYLGDPAIAEYRRSATDPFRVDHGSRRVVLTVPHREAQNHNGGRLAFWGGLLYASIGDGGAITHGRNSPDLRTLLGKILRINPRQTASKRYGTPPSNPYVGRPGRDEIYAYGLRNPWRISVEDGRIAIGDVGAARFEEIDFARLTDARGANFGWPAYEGFEVNDPSQPGPDPPTFPVLAYGHGESKCSVTGGFTVDNAALPELDGRYLYADFCDGEVRSFRLRVNPDRTFTAVDDSPAGLVLPRLTTFGQGRDGEVYVAQITGQVSQLTP